MKWGVRFHGRWWCIHLRELSERRGRGEPDKNMSDVVGLSLRDLERRMKGRAKG
jgi:hypothetical protein